MCESAGWLAFQPPPPPIALPGWRAMKWRLALLVLTLRVWCQLTYLICFIKTSALSAQVILRLSLNYLGVTILSNLKWDIYIKDIVHRANASISLLNLLNKSNIPTPFFKDLHFICPRVSWICLSSLAS